MEKLLQHLTTVLRSIHPESYYQMNPNNPVTYPYLTFDITIDELARNTDGVTMEIDIFGDGSSPLSVVQLEESLTDALEFKRELTTDFSLMYNLQNSLTIPTQVPDLHRRNVTFYIKTVERNKQYGIS